MTKFLKEARVSARVHIHDKELLKKNGYNARHAIEYFNQISSNKLEALKIEAYFLSKEIEDREYNHLVEEREIELEKQRLERLQRAIDEYHIDVSSSLRVESYQKIIQLYNRDMTNQSFEDFITGTYIQEKFIRTELDKFPDCDMGSFCKELLEYYDDVILCE